MREKCHLLKILWSFIICLPKPSNMQESITKLPMNKLWMKIKMGVTKLSKANISSYDHSRDKAPHPT
jgi:hypothetical protein